MSKIIYLYALLLPQAHSIFFICYTTEKGLKESEWKEEYNPEKACRKAGQ